jgi:glycosyltransferase involved in cell wall biosynthesis
MNQHLDSITYLGQILSFDIPQYLMKATALLVTPHKNYVTRGFPTKLTEYLISGTPVICTSIDDLKTELGNDNVYMVSPNDISAIKNAMLDIVSNKNKAQKIGLNGRNFAINKFTMRNYVQALMTFLKL